MPPRMFDSMKDIVSLRETVMISSPCQLSKSLPSLFALPQNKWLFKITWSIAPETPGTG